jgi:hypothetical protein
MKNGLYSIHIHMLDGVRGRDSGVIILRDGQLISGGPYFWSVGSYTVGSTWAVGPGKDNLPKTSTPIFLIPLSVRCSASRK